MQQFFEKADESFLQCLDDGQYSNFVEQLLEAMTALQNSLKQGSAQPEVLEKIARKTSWLHCCAQYFLEIEQKKVEYLDDARFQVANRLDDIAKDTANDIATKSKTVQCETSPSGGNSSQILRHWFLDNIAHPFPSADIKSQLAESTKRFVEEMSDPGKNLSHCAHAPTTYGQVQLWFINTRRRSQWTIFRERFAGSDRSRMERLCSLLSSKQMGGSDQNQSDLCRTLAEGNELDAAGLLKEATECRRLWSKMINWIEQKPAEETCTWLDDAIREGTNEYEDARRKVKEQRRRIREFQAANGEGAAQAHTRMVQVRTKRGRPGDEALHSQSSGRKSRKVFSLNSQEQTANRPSQHRHNASASRSASGSSASSASSVPSLIEPDQASYESTGWQLE